LPSRKHSARKPSARPDRERAVRTPRISQTQLDQEAYSRREQGQSFSAIARGLEFKRSKDALAAFHRVLRSKPDDERAIAVQQEQLRLDALESRIRVRDEEDPDKRERRLAALENLRGQL